MGAITIKLIQPNAKYVEHMGEVTSLASLNQAKNGFDPNGLYSSEIFSVSGSSDRLIRFGYIRMNRRVIHPKIYQVLVSLSKLYKGILDGTRSARYDETTNDFVSDKNGDTGYTLFIRKLPKIRFTRNKSRIRDKKIDLVYKAVKDKKLFNTVLLVIPAGLRDYEISPDGRVSEDEVNDMYRNVIRSSDLLGGADDTNSTSKLLDPVRMRLQDDVNSTYEHLLTLINGKYKHLRGSWIKRGIDYGTANIFSGIPIIIKDLEDTDNIHKPYETAVGVLQTAHAFLPLVYYRMKELFINSTISPTGDISNLVDPKTYNQVNVELELSEIEKWMTQDGIISIINRALDDKIKNSPVMVAGKYMKLIYDNGDTVSIIDDINFTNLEREYIRPITYGEFLFISTYHISKKYPATIARHPIIEEESTYYTLVNLRSTTTYRTVKFNDKDMHYYPNIGGKWVNTTGLHYSKLSGLGADFDGDAGPFIGYLTIEAAEEAMKKVKSVGFYISSTSTPTMELVDDIVELVSKSLTNSQ